MKEEVLYVGKVVIKVIKDCRHTWNQLQQKELYFFNLQMIL
jgi:hypothetical protein